MKLPDKLYTFLKWLCLIALPAISVFMLTVLPVLGVAENTVTIVVTLISAVGTLIGALIGVSTHTYYNGKK